MRSGVLVVALIAGCSFQVDAGPGQAGGGPDAFGSDGFDAAVDASPQDFHLRIEVLVDGSSFLFVKGTTLHWQHFVYAAPGRWQGVIEPTLLDGTPWFPTWPDQPTTENRDCNGCLSSTYELPIGVPRVPSTTTITEVQVRRSQRIVQAPAAANDYTLIAEITDQGVGNGAQYIVELDVKVD